MIQPHRYNNIISELKFSFMHDGVMGSFVVNYPYLRLMVSPAMF